MRASIIVGGAAVLAALSVLGGWTAPSHSDERVNDATTAASAAPAVAQGTPLTVLLMGDSYTAGNGARTDAGERAYYGPDKCMRSTATWGEQYGHMLEARGYAVTLLNRACSAATTDAILHDRYMKDTRVLAYPEPEAAGDRLPDSAYIDWARTQPRCTPAPATEEYFRASVLRTRQADGSSTIAVECERWLRPQVDALNPDVDLVLLTAGGNDVHFPDIVRECLIMGNAGPCEQAIDTAEEYVNGPFDADLERVFAAIEERTNAHAKIAYLAYPGLEVSSDLTITSVGRDGITTFPVAQRLSQLQADGMAAQRRAVAAATDRFGEGVVTYLDAIPAMFRGHEPDARPVADNPKRWMYEVFETTMRDEWYHLKPEGQRQIARYVASYGDFGAADDNGPARDVAVVVGDRGLSRLAVQEALADARAWGGAAITLVEQRVGEDGLTIERRVLASRVSPDRALAALATGAGPAWRPAVDVTVDARWNAAAQTIFVGDAALSLTGTAPVWTGAADGRRITVDERVVDVTAPRIGGGESASRGIAGASQELRERLAQVLADAASVPHAWAGGPYVAQGTQTVLTASGSAGQGDLTYAWDLDGDGVAETSASGPELRVAAGRLRPGWVSVSVVSPGGYASVAWAWVASAPVASTESIPCLSADAGGAVRAHEGRQGCRPSPSATGGPFAEPSPLGSGEVAGLTSGAGAEGENRLLAALTLVPLFADERVVTAEAGRTAAGSARRSPGRDRPRHLVRRERALAALLGEGAHAV